MLDPDQLRGKLFPAVPVPLSAEGGWHAAAHERYVAHMAQQPIGGVAVWAHTGRGLRLDPSLRRQVLKAWRTGLPPGMHVIAAAGATPGPRPRDEVLDQARAMAREAADLGADALLAHPPVAFRGHADQERLVLEYHAALAEASGLPLILFYLYEAAGGVSYAPHVLAQLLARRDVLGIKVATLDSIMMFQQIAALVRSDFPEKLLISGEDRFLAYSIMCGADSALIGMGAACTGIQAELLACFRDGKAEQFLELSRVVDELGQHTFVPPMEGYILRMLWCLVHQGIIPPEAAHDPWGPPLGSAESEDVYECLERIGQLPRRGPAQVGRSRKGVTPTRDV
jgi:4-hydroxy-tetrahydrodipicolinate synthase